MARPSYLFVQRAKAWKKVTRSAGKIIIIIFFFSSREVILKYNLYTLFYIYTRTRKIASRHSILTFVLICSILIHLTILQMREAVISSKGKGGPGVIRVPRFGRFCPPRSGLFFINAQRSDIRMILN